MEQAIDKKKRRQKKQDLQGKSKDPLKQSRSKNTPAALTPTKVSVENKKTTKKRKSHSEKEKRPKVKSPKAKARIQSAGQTSSQAETETEKNTLARKAQSINNSTTGTTKSKNKGENRKTKQRDRISKMKSQNAGQMSIEIFESEESIEMIVPKNRNDLSKDESSAQKSMIAKQKKVQRLRNEYSKRMHGKGMEPALKNQEHHVAGKREKRKKVVAFEDTSANMKGYLNSGEKTVEICKQVKDSPVEPRKEKKRNGNLRKTSLPPKKKSSSDMDELFVMVLEGDMVDYMTEANPQYRPFVHTDKYGKKKLHLNLQDTSANMKGNDQCKDESSAQKSMIAKQKKGMEPALKNQEHHVAGKREKRKKVVAFEDKSANMKGYLNSGEKTAEICKQVKDSPVEPRKEKKRNANLRKTSLPPKKKSSSKGRKTTNQCEKLEPSPSATSIPIHRIQEASISEYDGSANDIDFSNCIQKTSGIGKEGVAGSINGLQLEKIEAGRSPLSENWKGLSRPSFSAKNENESPNSDALLKSGKPSSSLSNNSRGAQSKRFLRGINFLQSSSSISSTTIEDGKTSEWYLASNHSDYDENDSSRHTMEMIFFDSTVF